MGLRLVVGHRRVSRLVARSTLLDGSIAADVFQRLGVSGVRLYESEAVGAPTVCGLRRPAIIFPRGWFDSVERAEVESLLAHEVAHIKRRDVAANLVQRLIEIPLFFHPGVWLASGRIALAREELADGWALRNGAEADTYARALTTAVERAQKGFAGAAVGIAESKSMLRRRVDAVLRAGSLRRLNLRLSLALLLMGALVATGLAAFRVVAADEEGKESSGAAVEVVSPEAALSPQELDSVLSTAGLQSYRFTYEFDRPHQLHFTFEEYVDGVKVGNGPSSSGCGSAMRASDAKRAVLIVTRREKGTIGFWFSVGGGGSGLSGFEIDEASGYTSGLLRGAELEVGKRVPIFYYASDRESVGGIDALDEMIASYDRVTVVLAEIVLPGEAEEDAGEAGSRGATTLIQGGLRAPDGKPAAGAG
jgi:hypothetical protein